MKFILSPDQCHKILGGTLIGERLAFNDVAFDSRRVQPGSLFVALPGAQVDGHAFVTAALAQGATGLIVQQQLNVPVPQLVVNSSLAALGRLGAWYFEQSFTGPVVAVTGSCGKTTVRNMVGVLLSSLGQGCITQGNYNTEVGVPMTALRVTDKDAYAVIEMGAKRQGDINYLTKIIRPEVGILTCVHPAHIKVFGSLDTIAHTKGEMLEALSSRGVGIYPYGSKYDALWKRQVGSSFGLTFGLEPGADISASNIQLHAQGSSFLCHTPNGSVQIECPLLAEHNVANALAAIGAAMSLGIPSQQWSSAMSMLQPEGGRLQVKAGRNGLVVIDDTYNGIYQAVLNALSYLKQRSEDSKTLILGDLAELGDDEVLYHQRVGHAVKEADIDLFIAVGPLMEHAARAHGQALWFKDKEALAASGILKTLKGCVLLKGSRRMRMEEVVHQLTAEEATV